MFFQRQNSRESLRQLRRGRSCCGRILEVAVALAHKSDMTHKHGAVLVGPDGSLIGKGYNYIIHGDCCQDRWSCHAEVAALRSVRPSEKWMLPHATLLVVRVGPGDALKMSRPCDACCGALKRCGIGTVVYSNAAAAAF